MAQQLGRIGGHLLNPNLVREGVDLAFKNTSFDSEPILFLDVENGRVGIKTDSPVYDLDIRTDISTTNFGATDQMEIDQVYINADGFFTTGTGPLQITPSGPDPIIVLERLISDNIQITDNKISTFDNSSVEFDPNGTGTIELQADVNLVGNISTTENININGDLSTASNIIIGDSPLDTVTITPELEQGLTTGSDLQFNLGSSSRRWAEMYSPDMTNIANVRPEAARVSSQMLIDGVNNEINTLQSNDSIDLITGFQNFVVDEIVNPNIFGTEENDNFGRSVDTVEQYSIIGAPSEDDGLGLSSGAAYIFDNFEKRIKHKISNPNAERTSNLDRFGSCVAINSTICIVGAPFEDSQNGTGSFDEGKAYIFDNFSGELLFTLNQPTTIVTDPQDNFGFDVALNESYIIVSAPKFNKDGVNSGAVFLFNTSGDLLHTFLNPDHDNNPLNDRFGESIAISNQYVIVGSPNENSNESNSGKVYIFDLETRSLIHSISNINAIGSEQDDKFGSSVAISDEYFVVGSYNEDNYSGRCYVFETKNGNLIHTLSNPLGSFGAFFGFDVDISKDIILVGAYKQNDSSIIDNGKAFVFNARTGNLLSTIDNPNPVGSGDEDFFGRAVSIFVGNNTTNKFNQCLIGADLADNQLPNSGKTYLFTQNKFPLEIESTTWLNSIITNNLNTPLTLASTGIGYTRFIGSNGMIIPAGTNAQRPAVPEIGDTRWNTDEQYLECFDGSVYIVSIGEGDPVTEADMEDFGTIYSLFLG